MIAEEIGAATKILDHHENSKDIFTEITIDLSAATNFCLALGVTALLWTIPGWHLFGFTED